MPFQTKEYDVYGVLSGPHSTSPWSWEKWKEIAKELEPFVASSRGKVSLRTTQLSPDKGKKVPFGKLVWNEESFSRWTHHSPSNAEQSAHWKFLGAEAWAPSWTQCQKENDAPDFFLSLKNEHPQGESEKSLFGAILIVALSASEPEMRRAEFRAAITSVARSLSSPLTVWKRRTWGKPFGTAFFTAALNDICKWRLKSAAGGAE